MRTTSNPAFRNLPTSGGSGSYAGFGQPYEAQQYGGFQGAPPTTGERPITIDDVVTKTAITLATTLLTGLVSAWLVLSGQVAPFALMLPGLIVGLVVSLIIIFKRTPSAPLVMTYAVAEGVFLGAITGVFEALYSGIAWQAILGTFGVFGAMLVVYKTGAIRVTPRLTKWIIGATVGVVVLMLGNLVLGLFGVNSGLRDGGTLAIVFSLVVIGIAAFNFLLDFEAANEMIRSGVPAKWAWWAAFGLMTTLVWLYLEILRLLSYLQRD
ncbi:putative YccA/Bax inhibitor family protein [Saccharothrix tamanrassetensis]|uniref:Putative YccA/Bax inhibitor family protein n=1 Tax=Saccharothrix tamanrassetensis TaxID=1051531 RepID=A0A841CJW1_9PSEU|nr:Bax inhibitor-1/YccA family protein [Saccharothrix tamanrassetensis]MBB5956285.1 putative YccA/Bax inhibitor family protein [Saccharothrix tamanrassetensis]